MSAPRHDLPTDPPLSRLYREQALAEPSAAVDQRVLAAARQALASPAPGRRQGWWQRWRLPLSLASTVMLTVMLALLLERQPAELARTPSVENKMEVESAQMRAEPASVAPAPAPAPAKAARTPAAPSPRQKSVSKVPAEQGVGERSPAATQAADQAAAPPPLSPARSAAPAAAAVEATASDEKRAAPAHLAAPRSAPLLKSTTDSARSPAAWLDEIRALRRAGKAEEAERQLSEFRLAYPDYPVPEEFRQ